MRDCLAGLHCLYRELDYIIRELIGELCCDFTWYILCGRNNNSNFALYWPLRALGHGVVGLGVGCNSFSSGAVLVVDVSAVLQGYGT